MGVLAMLEVDGDTTALLEAAERLERLLPAPEGSLLRIVAPTDTGMVLFQLWSSAEARQRNADAPGHSEALAESGMMAAATGTRSRVFEDADLFLGEGPPD